jgi:prepilin-type N-terminal cleavage/methylation domain-containing protein
MMASWRCRERVCAAVGVTLLELLVVLAVLGTLAAITVPALASGPSQAVTLRAAQRLGTALRLAQAWAQDGECRTRVVIVPGFGVSVDRRSEGCWATVAGYALGGVVCSTNYPGGAVEFDRSGLPLSVTTGAPRAGTFTLARGSAGSSVVVQLTGRVRVR